MKYLQFIPIILLLISCQDSRPKDNNIPWYISERIKTGVIENYNFSDSLKKYENLRQSEISDPIKYISYITDLNFKIGNTSKDELKSKISALMQANQNEICEKLIHPGLKYITPTDRPDRRYSRPYITELDMNDFVNLCIQCDFIENNENSKYEIGKLKLSNIMLKDQWFRIPGRPILSEELEKYDIENRNDLDQLYKSKNLDIKDDNIRSDIYVLLLHSVDCDWSRKWLRIYFDNYRSYSKYKDNLSHFLNRSFCEDEETIRLVKEEISALQI